MTPSLVDVEMPGEWVTVYASGPLETRTPKPRRTCNRHDDCEAADKLAQERTGNRWRGADHCHDDCCEDCFGQ